MEMDWQAFALSLRLATVTTAILLAIAVPLAALLVLGRSRWLAALEALATLPMKRDGLLEPIQLRQPR